MKAKIKNIISYIAGAAFFICFFNIYVMCGTTDAEPIASFILRGLPYLVIMLICALTINVLWEGK